MTTINNSADLPGATEPTPFTLDPEGAAFTASLADTQIDPEGAAFVASVSQAAADETDYEGANFVRSLSDAEAILAEDQVYTTSMPGITVGGLGAVSAQQPLENPLHSLNNYTYNLSLHLIGTEQFNRLLEVDDPNTTYLPLNVLVASAGKYSDFFSRNSKFYEDFYFENFRMKTYISTTHRNRNSNLIECSFTLIEPNGFTFIDRLIDAFIDVEGEVPGNFLQVPYMIQIDFYGYDEDGNLLSNPLEDFRKYIPVRLTNVTSKITTKGTEYNVTCVPFNHQAFQQTYASLEFATTVSGITVSDIFGKLSSEEARNQSNIRLFSNRQRELQNERNRLTGYLRTSEDPEAAGYGSNQEWIQQIQTIEDQLKSNFTKLGITGFCDAMNEWYQYLKDQGIAETVNSVSVVFDEVIGSAVLLSGTQPIQVGTKNDGKDEARAAAGQSVGITYKAGTVNIPATTDVTKLIDWAVRNSSYIGDQLKAERQRTDIQQGANPNTVGTWLNWFKIVPKIKLGQYDTKLKRYSVDITYYVKSFPLAAKHPSAPKGRVPGFVKKYDYIFTGKNKDVLDLNIELNALYLLEISAIKDKDLQIATNPADDNPPPPPDAENEFYALDTDPVIPTRKNIPVTGDGPAVVARSQDKKTLPAPGNNQAEKYAAGDVQRSLNNSAKGDMVEVSLKILGDPHFIKQDDIFMNMLNPISKSGNQFVNNFDIAAGGNTGSSLYMDEGELYVFLNFQTPVDMNELTSTADFDTNYRFSKYSGVYKILLVENVFSKGKFEQTLQLAKLMYDQEGQPLSTNNFIREPITPYRISERLNPTRYAGPLVNLAAAAINPVGLITSKVTGALKDTQNLSASAQRATRQLGSLPDAAISIAGRIGQQAAKKIVNEAAKEVFKDFTLAVKDLTQNGLSGVANNYGFEVTTDAIAESGIFNAAEIAEIEALGAESLAVGTEIGGSVGGAVAESVLGGTSIEAGMAAGAELAGIGAEVVAADAALAGSFAAAEGGALAAGAELGLLAEGAALGPIGLGLAAVAIVVGGGCFITTACTDYYNLPDDCYELTILRMFRDSYMLADDNRKKLVIEYYMTAPTIVEKLKGIENQREVYQHFYQDYILPAVNAIESANNEEALLIYTNLYNEAKKLAKI